jgi:hypothetical protein
VKEPSLKSVANLGPEYSEDPPATVVGVQALPFQESTCPLVAEAEASLEGEMPEATFASVTEAEARADEVTAEAASSAEVTAPVAILAEVTA